MLRDSTKLHSPGARRRGWRPTRALAWLFLSLAAACGADRRAEKQAQDEAAFAAAAKRDPELSDSLGQAIIDLAQRDAAGWVKEGKLLRGSLEERGRQSFLVVLKYGHCYRFLGVTDNEASDLDLLLLDPNGVEKQRDVTQGPSATLGVDASICPAEASAVRIEGRMRHGRGPFAIAVLHNAD
jgi:hypothetical protein